jgi:hypothetical protein
MKSFKITVDSEKFFTLLVLFKEKFLIIPQYKIIMDQIPSEFVIFFIPESVLKIDTNNSVETIESIKFYMSQCN